MARLIVAPRPAVMMRDRLLRLDQHDHRRGDARRQTAKPLEALAPLEINVFTSLGQGLKTNEKDPQDDLRQLAYVVR